MSDSRRVLLVGATGQVGQACMRCRPPHIELRACARAELDIADAAAVAHAVGDFRPDVIINAAAYTAVDKAESEPEAARRVNVEGARNLAGAASTHTLMIHLSTDFVFDGTSSTPYATHAPAHPLSVYGATKLEGEKAVRELLGDRAAIIRTAWLYSASGDNFFRTMLRLMAQGEVRVVQDQVGSPTSANSLAGAIWRVVELGSGGIFHWTDAGVASRHEFASAIAEEALQLGLLKAPVTVTPVATRDFPTPARRPAYSVLDNSDTVRALGISPAHWRSRLREVIEEAASA